MDKAISARSLTRHQRAGHTVKQRDRIYGYLLRSGRASRAEIAAAFALPAPDGPPIPLASVCGRVAELIEMKAVEVVDYAKNPDSGHRVGILAATHKGLAQMPIRWPS